MTSLVHDPKDGDLIAIIYRHEDGTSWLAEIQKRTGSFSLYRSLQARASTERGARRAARRLLRTAVRIEEAQTSKANPILVARERAGVQRRADTSD